MKKSSLIFLGLITLIGFPLPTFFGLYFIEGTHWYDIFEFHNLTWANVGLGLLIGVIYGFIALRIMKAPIFDSLPDRIERIVANMKLNILECLFLSICAGVGEELLFRSGVQYYLGPLITSVFFVAIHGYLNPWNWKISLYGLVVLPFILIISYGFIEYGLWFAITAHASYDFVLFVVMSKNNDDLIDNDFEAIRLKYEKTRRDNNDIVDLEDFQEPKITE